MLVGGLKVQARLKLLVSTMPWEEKQNKSRWPGSRNTREEGCGGEDGGGKNSAVWSCFVQGKSKTRPLCSFGSFALVLLCSLTPDCTWTGGLHH